MEWPIPGLTEITVLKVTIPPLAPKITVSIEYHSFVYLNILDFYRVMFALVRISLCACVFIVINGTLLFCSRYRTYIE